MGLTEWKKVLECCSLLGRSHRSAEQIRWVRSKLLPAWSQNQLCQVFTSFCAVVTVLLPQHEPHVLRVCFCIDTRSITVSTGRGQSSSLEDPICAIGSWERSLPHESQGSRDKKHCNHCLLCRRPNAASSGDDVKEIELPDPCLYIAHCYLGNINWLIPICFSNRVFLIQLSLMLGIGEPQFVAYGEEFLTTVCKRLNP